MHTVSGARLRAARPRRARRSAPGTRPRCWCTGPRYSPRASTSRPAGSHQHVAAARPGPGLPARAAVATQRPRARIGSVIAITVADGAHRCSSRGERVPGVVAGSSQPARSSAAQRVAPRRGASARPRARVEAVEAARQHAVGLDHAHARREAVAASSTDPARRQRRSSVCRSRQLASSSSRPAQLDQVGARGRRGRRPARRDQHDDHRVGAVGDRPRAAAGSRTRRASTKSRPPNRTGSNITGNRRRGHRRLDHVARPCARTRPSPSAALDPLAELGAGVRPVDEVAHPPACRRRRR